MGLPLALAVGGQILGGIGKAKSGKATRKATERANKEQSKQDAIINLIRLAGGQGPSGFRDSRIPQGSSTGDILSGLGSAAQTAGGMMQDQADKDFAAQLRAEDILRAERNRFEDQNIRSHELEAQRKFDELVRKDTVSHREAQNLLAQQRLPTAEERAVEMDYRRALAEQARRVGAPKQPDSGYIFDAYDLTSQTTPRRSPSAFMTR